MINVRILDQCQNNPPQLSGRASSESIEIAPKAIRPYHGSAFPGMPGVTNLVAIPFQVCSNFQVMHHMHKLRDVAGRNALCLGAFAVLPNFVGSLGMFLEGLGKLKLIALPVSIAPFLLVASICGILYCIIQVVMESHLLYRQMKFHKRIAMPASDSDIPKQKDLLDRLQNIQRAFFQVASASQESETGDADAGSRRRIALKQVTDFASCTSKSLAKEVGGRIHDMIEELQREGASEECKKKGHLLLKKIDVQSAKRRNTYILGIVALTLVIAAIVMTLFPGLPLASIGIFSTFGGGMTLGGFRFILVQKWVEDENWGLSLKHVMPDALYEKIREKEAHPVPL